VFSPYYALARRRGAAADAENHCTLNVALYGPRARWAMTERGRGALRRDAAHLAIGPSGLAWDGESLRVGISEMTVPWLGRVRGEVRLYPRALPGRAFAIDPEGRHRWTPLAPLAHVEVALTEPALRWSGAGYCDMNAGAAPLEADFVRWDWSCARVGGDAAVLYETWPRAGEPQALALRFDPQGGCELFDMPPRCALPPTRWRIARATRADAAHVVRTLEDTPFYARSVLATRLLGTESPSMHESLSLDRFRAPWVQAMLPFRMPRRAGR
jgi:carotenoid 1,2-hydratase